MDGQVVPDPRRRLPGRGAWLHPSPDCLRAAERRRAFPRALRVPGPLDVGPVRIQLGQPLGESGGTGPSRVLQDEGSRSTRHESAVKLKP
ncbi:MAG TPA: YlxR family protein [Pseudonocardiaceae bacterium]|nr:YlxR family protein [Pseudonocardiaceae bacterium]